MVISPLKVFAPDKVKVPDPCLVKCPVPLMTPPYVVSVDAAIVRVLLFKFTLPNPASDAIVSEFATS